MAKEKEVKKVEKQDEVASSLHFDYEQFFGMTRDLKDKMAQNIIDGKIGFDGSEKDNNQIVPFALQCHYDRDKLRNFAYSVGVTGSIHNPIIGMLLHTISSMYVDFTFHDEMTYVMKHIQPNLGGDSATPESFIFHKLCYDSEDIDTMPHYMSDEEKAVKRMQKDCNRYSLSQFFGVLAVQNFLSMFNNQGYKNQSMRELEYLFGRVDEAPGMFTNATIPESYDKHAGSFKNAKTEVSNFDAMSTSYAIFHKAAKSFIDIFFGVEHEKIEAILDDIDRMLSKKDMIFADELESTDTLEKLAEKAQEILSITPEIKTWDDYSNIAFARIMMGVFMPTNSGYRLDDFTLFAGTGLMMENPSIREGILKQFINAVKNSYEDCRYVDNMVVYPIFNLPTKYINTCGNSKHADDNQVINMGIFFGYIKIFKVLLFVLECELIASVGNAVGYATRVTGYVPNYACKFDPNNKADCMYKNIANDLDEEDIPE